ncbi:MAG: autotransporter outer membrane beta-barrel domain-containing protein, partial [Sphingomonas sp.]|uniref:autotransporter outer membrane beta-barrel domain-containing protein n=1 Tax=Sphingomonas sp. TaxID=28214 RepID=UPI003F8122ED
MRVLLASTCLTPVALFAANPAAAQSTISTAVTTPVKTSTANSGTPSDVSITSAGSVTVTSGTAVTIDSNNAVSNAGTIQITNADNATGIGTLAGVTGSINNTGKIIVDETYTPTDTDNDGDLDGPFASGTGRAGIRTGGAFTGSITNASGASITVEGNNSYGILLGGPLNGNLSTDGTITVTGNNSAGIKTGDINGNARVAGTITATGGNASAVLINGNVSGALTLQGTISSTGYRYTTAPADPSKLDADDLLQGGPAVSITGNVAGGVILAIPPTTSTTDPDVDKDGIPDASEGSAVITSYGSAAALQIGASGNSVTLGPVANTAGYGLIINGSATGNGVYAGVDANGVVIGGQGGAVTVTNGMQSTGTIAATSNTANATALRIGSGATVPTIVNSGIVSAGGASTAGQLSQGIVVDAGANVTSIRNTGSIKATASGTAAGATAIIDKSGSVTLVENGGAISASGADTTSTRNVAVDLSANTSGATVRQIVVASGTAPTIAGDVRFGSGNDTLDLGDGTMTGNATFGAGNNLLTMSGDATMTGNATFGAGNDAMTLAGTSVYTGAADFGGGSDTLTIGGTSSFAGTLTNASGLAVTVNGGSFTNTGTTPVSIASLAVTGGGTLGVTVNTTTNTATQYNVSGNASFDANSKLAIKLTGLVAGSGHYVVVNAGSITGASNLTASSIALPYMYKSSISTTGPANQIAIDIGAKTTTELGLNRSGSAAYNAIYAALSQDSKVGNSFLNITDATTFQTAIRQMLPDHAGGTFAAVSAGSRAIGRMLTDGGAPYVDKGKWGYWIEEVAYGGSKGFLNTASYDINGWGTAGGAEYKTKMGNFGLSLAYLHGNDDDNGTDNTVASDQYEVAGYWRAEFGGLRPFARVSAARVDFSSTRTFTGNDGTSTAVELSNSSKWKGNMVSATGGASYEGAVGHLTFRPILSVDYYRLAEDAHTETGGGKAFDLSIDKRT